MGPGDHTAGSSRKIEVLFQGFEEAFPERKAVVFDNELIHKASDQASAPRKTLRVVQKGL